MQVDRFLGVGAVDDGVGQPQGLRAGNAAPKVGLENLVVDGREVAENITAQNVAMLVSVLFVGNRSLPFGCQRDKSDSVVTI